MWPLFSDTKVKLYVTWQKKIINNILKLIDKNERKQIKEKKEKSDVL